MFGLFGKPSKTKFAKIVTDALRKAGAESVIFDEPDFSLKCGDKLLFLGNLHAEYCRADRAKKALLAELKIAEHGPGFTTTLKDLENLAGLPEGHARTILIGQQVGFRSGF
jgi:hypothetical protein